MGVEVRFSKCFPGVGAAWVKKIVSRALKFEEAGRVSVSVLLTDNKNIRALNKKFLNHDYATDVVSFGAAEKDFLGDVAVSVDMARTVSRELKIDFKEELARYLVHGTLHLLGYEDERPAKAKKMHRRQEKILKKILK